MTLPAFAAERRAAAPLLPGRRPLSVNVFCRHGAEQQTRRTPPGQTDGQTDGRFIDPAAWATLIKIGSHYSPCEQCVQTLRARVLQAELNAQCDKLATTEMC